MNEVVRILHTYQSSGRVPNCINRAASTPATNLLTVRHLNRPGVLAHVFYTIGQAGINVEEMENIIYDGHEAACARIQLDGTPSEEQGIVSFAYGNVNTILTWTPQGDGNLVGLVSGTYDLLRDNQPGLTFETLKDSELTVDGEAGLFLGFKAVDGSDAASGGLIGAWSCRTSQRSFTLTLTGADAAVVQVRFDGLLDNFKCST